MHRDCHRPVSRSAPFVRAALPALIALAAAGARAAPAGADDGLPSEKEVVEQARAVYADLAGNSDPLVRRAVFEGRVALGGDDRAKAVADGLADGDWEIRRRALELALEGEERALRKLRGAAMEQLAKMLASGDDAERARGYEVVRAHVDGREAVKLYRRAAVDGGPDGRAEARKAQIALGGKVAWAVITAGLKEAPGEREHQEALEALRTFADPVAASWALDHLYDEGEIGAAARRVLAAIEDKRAAAKIDRALEKIYEKNTADFPKRLIAASVLARRGRAAKVVRTLLAGVGPRFKDPAGRRVAWAGMRGVRDLVVLGKLREIILTNEEPAEADAAFAWMTDWARDTAEPKVIEILQEAARSDRDPIRMRAFAALTEIAHRGSVPLFEAAMNEGRTEVRSAAARGLAAVARPGDEQRLAAFLRRQEPDVEVKLALIEALARIGTAEIIDPLQFVMTAPQPEIKRAAMEAVAATGKPKAALLVGLLRRDPDLDIRFRAWQHLLKLDPRATVPQMQGALSWLTPEHAEKLAADPATPVEVLALIAEKGGDDLRPFAVEGLARRGADAATRLLSLVERSPHADTAAAALEALAEIRKDASVPTYRAAAESPHGPVRAAAFRAMGRYGPRALLEIVVPAMADREPLARARAAEAAVRLARRKDA